MFCPNCGTQNSETASTCTKCGFNLKGAAAPKFKGTMLMNQSPGGAPPGAPPVGWRSRAGPPPAPGMPQVQPMNPGLAGTVVGVPPAGLGMAPRRRGAAGASSCRLRIRAVPRQQLWCAAPPQQQYGAPPQQQYGAPPAQAAGGYSPAGPPQGGVNPLGGTMAIDQMPNFAAGGYGAAAPGSAPVPYGAPPQQPGAFGAPGGAQPGFPPPQGGPPGGAFGAPADQGYGGQQPYGAPPGQQPYGAPPGQQPYGAPQQPYGAPPGQQGYGGPTGQEMMQAGNQFGAAAGGALAAGFNAQPGAGPSQRNPVKTLILAYVVLLGILPSILATVLGIIGLGARWGAWPGSPASSSTASS